MCCLTSKGNGPGKTVIGQAMGFDRFCTILGRAPSYRGFSYIDYTKVEKPCVLAILHCASMN